MIQFRPHRGGLAEAMAEMVEVDGYAGLVEHLRRTHPNFGPPFNPEGISVKPYGGDDNRIGWKNVHMVTQEGWGPIGFTNGDPHSDVQRLSERSGDSPSAVSEGVTPDEANK
jgi:hypothetical protein